MRNSKNNLREAMKDGTKLDFLGKLAILPYKTMKLEA
jgi:hypothetical protein